MADDLHVVDCFGKDLLLHQSNWDKHALKRPEAVPYRAQIPTVLQDPDLVIEAKRDGHYHFYRQGLTRDRFVQHYLHVVVEYMGDGSWGMIKTWWLPRSVDIDGTLRWIRRPRT